MLKEQKIYRIQGDSDEVFLQYNLIKKFTFSVVKTIGRKKDELHWLSLQSLLKNIRTWSACYQVSSEQQNIRITYKQRAIDRYKGIFFWNSEPQSLEVTGNHPYFHKTAQNSQNPPVAKIHRSKTHFQYIPRVICHRIYFHALKVPLNANSHLKLSFIIYNW